MAMSSSECLAKYRLYASIGTQVIKSKGLVSKACKTIEGVEKHTDKLIISGKSVDNGKLSEVRNDVSSISDLLETVSSECIKKCSCWDGQYKAALKRESTATSGEISNNEQTDNLSDVNNNSSD